ncbi:hypothetical protein Ahy_A06g026347 [Arachis hypogaea]|uniref:Uncharacterized protein n=1 Tax=Arachis hypogaea TaxID=3818 RepID=A0A445CK90_ARAHY|nr:hypothetical protein Ahy_A06g026347 [Arachis hypogaea]
MTSQKLTKLDEEKQSVVAQMAELKKILYGKFKDSINLEEDSNLLLVHRSFWVDLNSIGLWNFSIRLSHVLFHFMFKVFSYLNSIVLFIIRMYN